MNLFNHTKDQKQFPIKRAILVSGALSLILGSNLDTIARGVDPTAQRLASNFTNNAPNSKLASLPSPKQVLSNDSKPPYPSPKLMPIFKQSQLNPVLVINLEKLGLLSDFNNFITNLQQESQIIISFPENDNKHKEQGAQAFGTNKILKENYNLFKLKIEKQIQTARLTKICGIKIKEYKFFEKFTGTNSHNTIDLGDKINNFGIGGYAAQLDGEIFMNVENTNVHSVLHEANHLDSLGVNSLSLYEGMYGVASRMLVMEPHWQYKLTPEKLINLFHIYQEFSVKSSEEYKYQGKTIDGVYNGIEFSSVETEEAIISDSTNQLIAVLGQLSAISGQEKFGSKEVLEIFNFIREQKGDIKEMKQLNKFKQMIDKLEKTDQKDLHPDSRIQYEAMNFQNYLKKVDQILDDNKNIIKQDVKKIEENKIIIRNLLRMIFVSITLETFFSFLTFISYPIIQKIENKLKE